MNPHVLRKRWVSITVITLMAIGGAAAASVLSPKVYQADTQMFVAIASQDSSAGQILSGSQFTLQRVSSYTQIVNSPRVLDPVIAELNLATTSSALAAHVTAGSPLGTVLINISVTDGSAEQAARISNAVAIQLGQTVEALETPESAGASPVKLSVVDPATPPTAPISPKLKLNLALGVLIGLALGIGYAVLREVLDTSVRSPEDLQRATDATPLGVVAFDADAKSKPLAALDPRSRRSEAFRMLRTNLQYVDVDHPPRSVVITSALPGEGKTTTACNLAITLGQAGIKVCLVEADLRRPRIADYLGIESAVGLTNVLAGQNDLDDVLIPWNRGLVVVLPSGPIPPNPSELLGSHNMALLLEELLTRFDVVLFDAPPLLPVTDAAVLAQAADGAILVSRHGKTTRDQAAGAVDSLTSVNARLLGTVLNFTPARSVSSGYGYGYGYGYESEAPAASERKGRAARKPTGARHSAGAAPATSTVEPPMPNAAPRRALGVPEGAVAPVETGDRVGLVKADDTAVSDLLTRFSVEGAPPVAAPESSVRSQHATVPLALPAPPASNGHTGSPATNGAGHVSVVPVTPAAETAIYLPGYSAPEAAPPQPVDRSASQGFRTASGAVPEAVSIDGLPEPEMPTFPPRPALPVRDTLT